MSYRLIGSEETVEAFQLHDGSDEQKTEELHKFFGDYTDWDGDESGVRVGQFFAKVGDWICKREGRFATFEKNIFPLLYEEVK